jgi:hypothetical protein
MKKKKLEKKVKKLEKRLKALEEAYEICDCFEDCGCHDNDDEQPGENQPNGTVNESGK